MHHSCANKPHHKPYNPRTLNPKHIEIDMVQDYGALPRLASFASSTDMRFPKLGVHTSLGLRNKKNSVLGSMLGSPYFEKVQY